MPLTEYPFDGSWGYQVTGYFVHLTIWFLTTSENGRYVPRSSDRSHLNWVPAHFPKDEAVRLEFDEHAAMNIQMNVRENIKHGEQESLITARQKYALS